MHIEHYIGVLCQGGLHSTGDGDDRNAEALQMRQQIEQFGGFTAIAQHDRQIVRINDSQVAMQRIADV